MKKQTLSLIIAATITSQILLPNTMAFATVKSQDKNTVNKEATANKNTAVKSNAAGAYTDAAMTQELKNPKDYIYPKEVTLNFSGTATLDGNAITSGIKVTTTGNHILKITNGSAKKTYTFSIINNINGKEIVSVSSGSATGVVDSAGKLYTWGSNSHGQIGTATSSDGYVGPVKVNGKGDIKENTKIVSVSMKGNTGGAIDSEGNLYTWGNNTSGQLGDGSTTQRNAPVKINGKGAIGTSTKIVSISNGGDSFSAIDSEGNLYTWGKNDLSQLGDGTNTKRPVPVKINGKGAIGTTTKVTSVSMAYNHCSAIDSEGNLYTWGSNVSGQLGDGTNAKRPVPVKINGKGAISTSTKIISISNGYDMWNNKSHSSSTAIDSEGNLYTWGSNSYGRATCC